MNPRIDAELAAALALRDSVDPYDLVAYRAHQQKMWRNRQRYSNPRVEMGYVGEMPGIKSPPVKMRSYRSISASHSAPTILWLHGGGFATGFCEIDDELCTWLAAHVEAHVFAPDYRLAPEHPFPAGLDDAYECLEWLGQNANALGIDPENIAVAGASAGGGLAAAIGLRSRDQNGPRIALQMLIYPVLDDRMTSGSMRIFGDSPVFNRAAAELMWDRYLGAERSNEVPHYAAPARAESLAALPPTYILTAEIDPLRDEGLAFAQRLIADGVPTELHHFPGTFHGFDTFAPTALISQRAWQDYVASARRVLCR